MQLFQDALYYVDFTNERAKTLISRFLNSIQDTKQNPHSIVREVHNNIYFNNQTFHHAASFLRQKQFLDKAKNKIDNKPEILVNKLQEIRRTLVKSKNTFVYVATDLKKLVKAHGNEASKVWVSFMKTESKNGRLPEDVISSSLPVIQQYMYRDSNPEIRHAIVGLTGTETCYMTQGIDFDINDWGSKDLAATRLMLKYLSKIMYEEIRGQGWTYGAWADVSVPKGRMDVNFFKTSDFVPAYKEFRKILLNYTDYDHIWDPIKLDDAKGTLIYDSITSEETPSTQSYASVTSFLLEQDGPFYNRKFVEMLLEVTIEDVRKVAQKYLPTFFYPNQTYTSTVCSPKDVKIVKATLEDFDFDLVVN